METNSTQQEILLMTGTTFSQRQWSENVDPDEAKHRTEKEQLEEACWNGMLKEMLPEIVTKPEAGKNIYLWQIREGGSWLQLEFSQFPQTIDGYFSIDPDAFMAEKSFN